MNRCLHITVHEHPESLPQRAATSLSGRTGSDPSTDYFMPKPDDPSTDYFMPKPDDPSTDYFMPKPDDPSYASFPSAHPGGYGAVVAAGPCGCATANCPDAAASGGAATSPSYISARDYSGFVIVRLAEGIAHPTARSLRKLAKKLELTGLKAALELELDQEEPCPLPSRPLVELRGQEGELLSRCDSLEALRGLEAQTAVTAFPPLHSLTAYWRLDLREHPDQVEEVVARLNRLPEVDLAYRELAAVDPRTTETLDGQDFVEDQGYLDDAPAGISASWAWQSLTAATDPLAPAIEKPTICDLEQGWNLLHEDLTLPLTLFYGANRAAEGGSGHHGTAVLGQLAAAGNNDFGVKGVVADYAQFVLASHYRTKNDEEDPFAGTNGHVAEAIAQALAASGPLGEGDILLLEVQRGRLPAEVDEADFDAIRLATGLGVIVVEAAGNGGFDLDGYSDPGTRRSLHRGAPAFRDSGAILVGAARAGLPHDRAPFSNYGSRLDCFGWGETVTTCGYGDLAGTAIDKLYTNSFSGTSSASPIIAGAAALLQRLHFIQAGERLGPRTMRALLADPVTGTGQGPNVRGRIGVMPDLRAIVCERLRLVPDVYLRSSLDDEGSPASPSDEISSSPDLLVWPQELAPASARFGAGSLRENLPAPGAALAAAPSNEVYVRLRNRGLDEGEAHVELFASPAATLITPERWIPVGHLDVEEIPQGDTLVVAGPLTVTVPAGPPEQTLWSLLAILSLPGEYVPPGPSWWFAGATGLPPGPPYFDWAEYRAFLRRPGVAWRNTHRIAESDPDTEPNPKIPSFYIAGTPDRAREFDFEVVQRLPTGAQVNLTVGAALAAKLRQRAPWLAGGTGETISLPSRPRTSFRAVQIAAGAFALATFEVNVDEDHPLAPGHSLALRQLWCGEEVGRITWFFGLDQPDL